jgi:hypothetical protein
MPADKPPRERHIHEEETVRAAWNRLMHPAILSLGFKVKAKGGLGWPKYLLE